MGSVWKPLSVSLALALVVTVDAGCGTNQDEAGTSEDAASEAASSTVATAATEADTGEPATICEAFEPGEAFLGDYFGDCWAAGSAEACAEAVGINGQPCHAAFARQLECFDDGSVCRLAEPRFVECQDLDECQAFSPSIVCRPSEGEIDRVLEFVESSCLVYGTSTCTAPVGFDMDDYDVCDEP